MEILGTYLLVGFILGLIIRISERVKLTARDWLVTILLYPTALIYSLIIILNKVANYIWQKLEKIRI